MSLLDIVHPAAKTLVDIAQAQDAEIGDGTTTVVLLAGEFLKAAKSFIEDGVHPQIVIRVRWCGKQVLVSPGLVVDRVTLRFFHRVSARRSSWRLNA
jgi:TCP-1/cpn60 chaperonin family